MKAVNVLKLQTGPGLPRKGEFRRRWRTMALCFAVLPTMAAPAYAVKSVEDETPCTNK